MAASVNAFSVHTDEVAGPSTHAIVIGVGAYPHLLGGTGALSPDHDGMGQLSSPPASARMFCRWLIEELNDPAKPLASVRLLLSELAPARFQHPATGRDLPVADATMEHVDTALSDWKARGDTNPENRLIFFFCGHGIAQGPETSLLLADYGQRPDDPLGGAIDFYRFHLGMNTCAAQQQCFFVDACRASSDTLIEAMRYAGRPIIQPRGRTRRAGGPREAPIYYSTVAGEDAYGRQNELSPFTDALLRALNGAGGDDSEGDWRVSSTRLKEAIDYFLRSAEVGEGRVQIPATGELTTFYLHYLDRPPEVPVTICCRPADATADAELSYGTGGRVRERRAPADSDWEVTLSVGSYEFAAEFAGGSYADVSVEAYVRPVYRRVPLKVEQ
jgi:caspase domain-containing protein